MIYITFSTVQLPEYETEPSGAINRNEHQRQELEPFIDNMRQQDANHVNCRNARDEQELCPRRLCDRSTHFRRSLGYALPHDLVRVQAVKQKDADLDEVFCFKQSISALLGLDLSGAYPHFGTTAGRASNTRPN